jgi:hypothetical protein
MKSSLDNIFSEKMNPNLAFKFLKLLKKIQNEYDNISEAQKKYISDNEGKDINVVFNEFLMKTNVDISEFPKVSYQDIIDAKINISPVDLNNISIFIEE